MKAQFAGQLPVSPLPISQHHNSRRLTRWIRFFILVATMLAPMGFSTVHAQNIPPACLDGRGNFPMPEDQVGAWVVVMNFEHAPSADFSIGCRVTTTATDPQQLHFKIIKCVVHNNINQVQIGGGNAPFDGNFWLECPPGPKPPGTGPQYDSFYIFGRASFASNNSSYTIMQHENASLQVTVNNNWIMELSSIYGAGSFTATGNSTIGQGQVVHFSSQVGPHPILGVGGAHFINGTQLQPAQPLGLFEFDFTKSFTIGGPGEVWTAEEIIFDPPPRCCFN